MHVEDRTAPGHAVDLGVDQRLRAGLQLRCLAGFAGRINEQEILRGMDRFVFTT
ncbi:hypothetical protein D3C78_1937070 [compost metagenome]